MFNSNTQNLEAFRTLDDNVPKTSITWCNELLKVNVRGILFESSPTYNFCSWVL